MTRNDFIHFPWNEAQIKNKGTGVRFGVKEYKLDDASAVSEIATINAKQEKYLRKIIELCDNKDIPLIIITTPTVPRGAEQPYYNAVAQIAEEYAVPYYNFNLMVDQIGFNPNYYWTDGAHLNTEGARFISKWLGNMLSENYDLTDHRGDEKYISWQENAIESQNTYISLINNPNAYFEELGNKGRTIFLIKNSSWELSESYFNLVDAMAAVGIDKDTMLTSKGGDWLITDTVDGEFVNQYFGNLYSEFEFKETIFTADFKNGTGISIDGSTIYKLEGPGVICIVYDSETKSCIDVVTFLQKNNFAMKHIAVK